jgi:hypothetical protein
VAGIGNDIYSGTQAPGVFTDADWIRWGLNLAILVVTGFSAILPSTAHLLAWLDTVLAC